MDVNKTMRAEWNNRAREDAHFYVAFGQKQQSGDDFLSSANEILPALEYGFQWLVKPSARPTRALEIGCGPGRLMCAMLPYFDELYGVDISDEMVKLATDNLREYSNATVALTETSDLVMFNNSFFDFVYSYVVFQHIPQKEIVIGYVQESYRSLKPGGVLRCQFRGKPPVETELSGKDSATWTGCYFSESEIFELSCKLGFPLVSLEGVDTQYLWATFVKKTTGLPAELPVVLVNAVTSASGPGRVIPFRGPEAAVSIWMSGVPREAGLADFSVSFGATTQNPCYLSPVEPDGGCQLNCRLPANVNLGNITVLVTFAGQGVAAKHDIVVTDVPYAAARVTKVTDGINLNSIGRINTRSVRVHLENLLHGSGVKFLFGGLKVSGVQSECVDPINSKFEFSFTIPEVICSGLTTLLICLENGEKLAEQIEVT